MRSRNGPGAVPARKQPSTSGLPFRQRYAWVTKISQVQIDHGVFGVASPGAPLIDTVGEILGLSCPLRTFAITGVNGYEAVLFSRAETACVVTVHNNASGEGHFAVFFRDCNMKLGPMQ